MNAVGEYRIVRLVAEARERQHRDRGLLRDSLLYRRVPVANARHIERDGHAQRQCEKSDDQVIHRRLRSRVPAVVSIDIPVELHALGRNLEDPCQNHGHEEADQDDDHVNLEDAFRRAEGRQQYRACLDDDPGDQRVSRCHAQHVAATKFGKKRRHRTDYKRTIAVTAVRTGRRRAPDASARA